MKIVDENSYGTLFPEKSWLVLKNWGRSFPYIDLNINLTLYEHKRLGLLGPSGSGKSTFLELLLGLLGPVDSTSQVFDQKQNKAIKDLHHHYCLSYVPQDYGLFNHLSVFDNVLYPLKGKWIHHAIADLALMKSKAKKHYSQQLVHSFLEQVGLTGLEYKKVYQLSGGEKQRVALARALIFNPDLLLLDEPFSALDTLLKEQLQKLIQKLQNKYHFSVIFVTHDWSDALSFAHDIAVMKKGKIIEVQKPYDLYHHPQSLFTAQLCPYSNLWKANKVVSTARDYPEHPHYELAYLSEKKALSNTPLVLSQKDLEISVELSLPFFFTYKRGANKNGQENYSYLFVKQENIKIMTQEKLINSLEQNPCFHQWEHNNYFWVWIQQNYYYGRQWSLSGQFLSRLKQDQWEKLKDTYEKNKHLDDYFGQSFCIDPQKNRQNESIIQYFQTQKENRDFHSDSLIVKMYGEKPFHNAVVLIWINPEKIHCIDP